MTSNSLKLNEVHRDLLGEFLRFCKYQVVQRLKSIDYCFTSVINCRVHSTETYTGDEVKTILSDLQEVVRGEVDTELTDGLHTSTLFVQQLLTNAEEWQLTLTANISELENREKLNSIKEFEQASTQGSKVNITVTSAKQFIPVEDMNVATALKQEITRLTVENDFLKQKIENSQSGNSTGKDANSDQALQQELNQAKEEISNLKSQIRTLSSESGEADAIEKLQIVQQAVDTLSKELETNKEKAEEGREKLKKDLESREDKLRQIQSSLLLAEKELDKKFQATTAYLNMKKILNEKNSKIKKLRTKVKSLGGKEEEEEEEKVEIEENVREREKEEEGFRI